MNRFSELKIWQVSVDFAVDVYKLTSGYPKEELYSLTNQTRRAAVSISSNIAEGANRNSYRDFKRFLNIASGSAAELQTQRLIAKRLEYINQESFDEFASVIEHIQNMNFRLQETLETKIQQEENNVRTNKTSTT